VPVTPIGPDSLAGALEVLIDLVADANSPDRGKPVFGSDGADADGDLPGAHALALHGSGFEVDVMDGLRVHAETSGLELEEKDFSGNEKAGSRLPASSRFSGDGEAGGVAAAL
jgi:hypothetical protein